MQHIRGLCSKLFPSVVSFKSPNVIQACGLKYFAPPPNYDDIILPERPRLKTYEKVPQFDNNIRAPKMQKRLKYMRGPERIHNKLQHKQFGIIATGGGRLKHEHFELMRLGILRKIDQKRMFAIWRVDPPWQPITKKGQGQRMGGGKGAIDHYVTPVKAHRVILEVGGKCEFVEVKKFLEGIACRLPFTTKVVSHEIMERDAAKEKQRIKSNMNRYTMKYLVQNNMGGCHKWLSPTDRKYFCKYV